MLSLGASIATAQGTTTTRGAATAGEPAGQNAASASNDSRADAADPTVARRDRSFVEKAVSSGEKELKLARVAVERSSDPRIRSFAESLVRDHQQVNNELNSLASNRGVVSRPVDDEDRHFRRLSELTGSDFDQEFLSHMITLHEQTVDMFEKHARKGDDPQVSALAGKTLPKLRDHLKTAQELKQELKR